EPTIGPYEVYEDNLMGTKAAFESFVTVADAAASAELDTLKSALRMLEERLPIPDALKNLERGFESPMRVVDVVYTAGDTRAGVQTIAFNLPNDERVRSAKGSKKVMLRNVSQAKFDQILRPIAERILDPAMVEELAFQPWFTSVLMHELAHGLGPGFIERDGERITVNQALQDRYSAIEEAKADVVGLHNLTVLRDRGLYDDAFVRAAFVGELPDLFRSIRFGASEAHGQANLIQFNWLWENGALSFDEEGRITADLERMEEAVRSLATELLTLQAEGDYERAGRVLEEYGGMRPEIEEAVARLEDVPVDIRPRYEVRDLMPEWEQVANRLEAAGE
ncbi:MAG: peptidase, partial [Gemmatimonadetes bacterium]|nr:peptidase [Gemmatimonadota bacterium]NIQ54980.1 peptidase [Gemmatimonadota bacterium]NIU75175.1 peptidase [Gammaproteobacteria bacterium]NIX44999.1 peptidase [Gemmatimonadota bacterium]NIY09224.1 peptidase [Gemmatimonadota bacterium]